MPGHSHSTLSPLRVTFHDSPSSASLYPPQADTVDGHDTITTISNGNHSVGTGNVSVASVPAPPPVTSVPSSSFFRSTSVGSLGLARQSSITRSTGTSGTGTTVTSSDWRSSVSVEDRLLQRAKIRAAYQSHCPTYDMLLDVLQSMDEEFLFAFSNSRVDYGKAGIDFETKIRTKKQQLATVSDSASSSGIANGNGKHSRDSSSDDESSDEPVVKKQK